MIMREGEALKQLQDGILGAKDVLNLGILTSPSTGQLVISMYYPLFEDDKPIGFVGGAVMAAGLKDILDSSGVKGMENATYSLVNVNTGVYIFDSDESLLGTEVKDENVLSIINDIKDKGVESGNKEFTGSDGKDYVSVYKSMSDRGWAFIQKDVASEVYSSASHSKVVLGVLCIIAFILITIVSHVSIRLNTQPLSKVLVAIDSLKSLRLGQDEGIRKYIGGKSEVGLIASAVDSLSSTLRDIIDTLARCSSSLTGSSDTMTTTSRELLNNVEANATTTQELSASILSTNSSIETVTREIDRMNELVDNIGEKVNDGNDKSSRLIETAGAMSSMADRTVKENTDRIARTKIDIDEAMNNLQALVKINEMATQILDITSQTNLLSLNASIEAARAGEAGRGFAVVAGEIGSLADSSSKTATEIQNICEEANKSIESVRECFEDIIAFMEGDVSEKFMQFADMAKEYGEAVKDIREAINSINDSSSMFIDSVTNIKDQVDVVNMASNDNAAGVEDIIGKNNTTTLTADSIISIANENQDNAAAIREIIERFN
jgi:methyl-accepting chemotaxis protein